ncbi:TonB-dependent receptor [Rhodocaloribacter litoris]|uniref:TonB-dependent receptor n=1 Tax=Rhodocaloribacter litoris TaxID=2558931 RepID=UPI001E5F9297|nr:TonB-dependent receptor [Rhodocaloribacter litoris]
MARAFEQRLHAPARQPEALVFPKRWRIGVRKLGLGMVLAFLPVATVLAQNVGRIAGTVTDASTGEPLPGVNVVVEGTSRGAATDVDGTYYILNVPPGRYDLRASMVGYEAAVVTDVIVHANRTTTVDFVLTDAAIGAGEVVVTAERPDVERDKTSTSYVVRPEEVQALPGIRDIGDVLRLSSDVVDGHFRGGRLGEEFYSVQGMGIMNPLDNSAAFMPIMSAVEEVEVITSGFGAQYGNAQSGVVRISMKEGDRTAWRTQVEARVRPPGRKHFGPSVFDPDDQPYLRLLLVEGDIWLRGDPGSDDPQPFYGAMASGLTSYFAGDTLAQLAMARALYEQTRRDAGRTYGQNLDHSVELATGGPINDRMRMFVALRTLDRYPFLPTERPDTEQQVMGNLVTDLWDGAALRVSGGLLHERESVFPSRNSVGGYQQWLWDRVVGLRYRKRTNVQLGARLTHALSPSTYYEVQLSTLQTSDEVGSTPVPHTLPDTVNINWFVGTLAFPNNNSPDGLDYQIGNHTFSNEKSRTISFDGSITSQVTEAHLVNGGVQVNAYSIDVANMLNVRTSRLAEDYTARPFEAAVYLQDKMEFEGLIANVGLRLDLWYSGMEYYTDLYTPFGSPDSTGVFDPEAGTRSKAPVHVRVQPRVGISFPVTASTVFHLNYGAFMQRPSFQYIVSRRIGQVDRRPDILGNPALKPETTNSYDIGVLQGLGAGFTLDVSGYYKDVKNLVEQAQFTDERAGYQVASFFNLDYADIRGFRIALNKRRGALQGSLNYQYSYATGKSPNATAASPLFSRDTLGVVTSDLTNVPTRDIILDFDRTHNLIVSLTYLTGDQAGPKIGNVRPFANMSFSVYSTARSGRPYTSPTDIRLINTKRTPAEYNTDVSISKHFPRFFGASATFYFEIFNLFNNAILNYNYLFRRPTATNPNLALQYYETYGIEDPDNGVRYWWDKGRQGPFAVDQSFLIYSNEPRSYSLGVRVTF